MNLSRRNFVKTGGASALAIAALSGTALSFGSADKVLETMSAASFQSLIGSEFYIWNEQGTTVATLTRVDAFEVGARSGECFGLMFATSKKQTTEGTFSVFSAQMGNFELFMTAATAGRRGGYYATVNRT